DMPVTKYLKTLTLLSSDSIPDLRTTQCINCGFCRSVCPMGIQPDRIFDHRINNTVLPDEILLSAYLCDNCALCNAACPARLPLHQTVSNYKEHPYAPKV
ncbi:4Fe-4S dicluster domain-containing protein, partial [Treponema lecithinolyticum]